MCRDLKNRLKCYSQEHLLQFFDDLDKRGQEKLTAEIEELDLEEIDDLISRYVLSRYSPPVPREITPAPYFPALPENPAQEMLYKEATVRGRELLAEGRVAALTVAGGQGSRLGFEGPKGSYPITPVRGKSLFQYLAESLARAGEKFGTPLRWYIMTSKVNHHETVKFFEDNSYFGLDSEMLTFFTQGTMPAISFDGKILLQSKDSLALAPDGHGGTLLAMKNSGALQDMINCGIEHISYFQVDNPLVSVVNPLFIGLHDLECSEISTRALVKTGPHEKLGNFCIADGRLTIIEYSDMPDELAEARDSTGDLVFRVGSPAIHVISRGFVERLAGAGDFRLPWHRADKKVPFVDQSGSLVRPQEPNAVKLETFIFDAIPLAGKSIILEARREDQFAPVKNAEGTDSAESCRSMLMERDAQRLKLAGVDVPRDTRGRLLSKIELSPRRFLDQEDVIDFARSNTMTINPGEEIYIE
ncbi:MAG: UDPGP type 1 family protein [Victivallales bacterium]|nr:UDPGP type 1 family protein [Victivallales bacterium]